MKTKKILAALFSAVTTISAVSPVISNALHPWGSATPEVFENFEEISDDFALKYRCYHYPEKDYNPSDVFCTAFLDKNNNSNKYAVYYVYQPKNMIQFSISELDIPDLKEKLAEINTKISISEIKQNDAYNGSLYNATDEEAKKICELLGDKVVSFKYTTDMYSYFRSDTALTEYEYSTDEKVRSSNLIDFEEVKAKIEKYIEENNINADFTVEPYANSEHPVEVCGNMKIKPKDDITPLEHFEMANDIYELTGLKLVYSVLESSSKSTKGTTLDLTNYLNGDSNCDKKQTIADAVAILQFLGNPDDYPLSELGAFNADSDCNGITADDAVRIQQKDAGIL